MENRLNMESRFINEQETLLSRIQLKNEIDIQELLKFPLYLMALYLILKIRAGKIWNVIEQMEHKIKIQTKQKEWRNCYDKWSKF